MDLDELIVPSTQPQQQQPTPPQTVARSQRHEAFKAKLLGRNFGRRRSLDLDDAEEQFRRGGDQDDADDGGDGDQVDEEEDEPSSSKAKMKSLKDKLTVKGGKGKEVANTKGGGNKKGAGEAVGPSGLSWTPMEKQVSTSRVFEESVGFSGGLRKVSGGRTDAFRKEPSRENCPGEVKLTRRFAFCATGLGSEGSSSWDAVDL